MEPVFSNTYNNYLVMLIFMWLCFYFMNQLIKQENISRQDAHFFPFIFLPAYYFFWVGGTFLKSGDLSSMIGLSTAFIGELLVDQTSWDN